MQRSFYIDKALKEGKLENEFVYELAMAEDNSLRILCKTNPSLKPKRKKLRDLIENYETKYYS